MKESLTSSCKLYNEHLSQCIFTKLFTELLHKLRTISYVGLVTHLHWNVLVSTNLRKFISAENWPVLRRVPFFLTLLLLIPRQDVESFTQDITCLGVQTKKLACFVVVQLVSLLL